MDKQGIINVAMDLQNGVQLFADSEGERQFSAAEAEQKLREALIAANGGSTVFNYKTFRRNKTELFEIIEELVEVITENAFERDNFLKNYVEMKNTAKGDKNVFLIPATADFVVCDTADGINMPRRQRLNGGEATVKTRIHEVRMYDEFSRFMAGRVDWATLCDKVAKAFIKDIWMDIYTELEGITANTQGMSATYVKTGNFDEQTLLDLCAHIEAETGEAPVIVGTANALRHCVTANGTTAMMSNPAKEDLYNMGYYGKFNGYPMVKIPQLHKPNTDTFALNDKIIHVFAGGEKFVKFVDAGETFIHEATDGVYNKDRTLEFLMEREYGVGVVIANHTYGKYTLS